LRGGDTTSADRTIAILLATFNGERFIDEQLNSIAHQTISKIDVYVSDDGSTDRTLDILQAWQRRWNKGRFEISAGPRRGFAENFRGLMRIDRQADYLAFSDQDDVWDANKLEAAISWLDRGGGGPALYVSRTRLIDSSGHFIGLSPLFARPPDFGNAMVKSVGGGNTAVMNRSAMVLVAESAQATSFVSHDWWCYLICTGAGGRVFYDPDPHMGYRQHDQNVVGRNSGWSARARRVVALLQGRFARWTDTNLDALKRCDKLLTEEANVTVQRFVTLRKKRGYIAVRGVRELGLFRQTFLGQLGLLLAAFIGKI